MSRYQNRNDNFNRRDNSRQKFRGNGTKTEWEKGRRRVLGRMSISSELCSVSYIDDCEQRGVLTNTAHSKKPTNGRHLLNQRFLDENNNTNRFEVGNLKHQSKRRLHTDGRESSNTSYCYPLENQHDYKNNMTKYEHYHHRKGDNNRIRNKENSANSMHAKSMSLQRRNREIYYEEDLGFAIKQNENYPKVRQQEKHNYARNHHREGENGSLEKYPDKQNLNPIRNTQRSYERANQIHEAGHRVRYNEKIKKNNFPHITKHNTLFERNTEVNKNGTTLRNRTHTKENYLKTDSCLDILNARIQQRRPKNGNYNEGSRMPSNQIKEFRNGYHVQAYDRGIANVYNNESGNASSIQLEEEEEMKSDNSLAGAESHNNSMGRRFERDVTVRQGTDVTIDDPKIIQIAKLILDGFQKDKDLERKYRETVDGNNIHRKRNTDNRRYRTSKTNDNYTHHKIPTQRSEDVYSVNRIVSQNIINYGRHIPGVDEKPLKAPEVLSLSFLREQNHRRSFDKVEGYQTKGCQTSTSKTTRRLPPREYQEKQSSLKKLLGKKHQSSSREPQSTEKIREVSVQLENQLPLYDENAHLLGYLKEGTLIIGPSCPKSCDSSLNLNDENYEHLCPFSICNKATQLKDVTNTPTSARWTYGSNFASSVRHQLVKAKFDRCPKCVQCNEMNPE